MGHQDPTWRVIPHHEGHQVNSSGEIRNIASGKILEGSANQTGVRYVGIQNTTERRYRNVAVGVLVASAFCPGRSDKENTVLHLNGNTLDCRAENLMWASRFHAIQFHQEMNDTKDQPRTRVQDETGRIYRNIRDAAQATGCLPSAIDYAMRYNQQMAVGEHRNMVQRCYPGSHTFRAV